jgi:hypothetical protein
VLGCRRLNGFIAKALRRLGLVLLASSFATVGVLAATDVAHGLRSTGLHSRLGALALILVGSSYMSLQVVSRRRPRDLAKGVILGIAFVLWGLEQLLPANRWTTAMDSAVILIFVVDLGLIILDGLERPPP